MAFPNLSEIVTTTLRNRTGTLQDNVSRNNALLARLNKKGRIKTFSGGRTIIQELDYANNSTFTWYSGYQTLNINPSQVFSAAEFPIRQAALAISISGLEEIQNSGEEAIIGLLEGRVENGERTFMNGLSNAVYGDGTVSGSIGGLQLLVAKTPTSGVVGGIDRSQWSFWQNVSFSGLTNGGAAVGPSNIVGYMDTIWPSLVRGRDYPDLIVADNVMWRYYTQALQSIQRIGVDSGAPELGEAGYMTLKYMQADIVLDGGYQGQGSDPLPFETSASANSLGGVPVGFMYFLNTNYLHWRPAAQRNMVPLDPDRFSVNQDAMVRLIGFAGNLTVSNCFLQGVLVP
jgi:hypothetical protein